MGSDSKYNDRNKIRTCDHSIWSRKRYHYAIQSMLKVAGRSPEHWLSPTVHLVNF